jgi:hypothetical protein
MSRLSTQCGILNISQPYRPPWPVMGIALLYYYYYYYYYYYWAISNREPSNTKNNHSTVKFSESRVRDSRRSPLHCKAGGLLWNGQRTRCSIVKLTVAPCYPSCTSPEGGSASFEMWLFFLRCLQEDRFGPWQNQETISMYKQSNPILYFSILLHCIVQ